MEQRYPVHLRCFARKWAPGQDERREFLEDLRGVIVFAHVNFLHCQLHGKFADGIGLKYLQHCVRSLGDIHEQPTRTRVAEAPDEN